MGLVWEASWLPPSTPLGALFFQNRDLYHDEFDDSPMGLVFTSVLDATGNNVSHSGSYACGLVVHKLSCPCYFEDHSFPATMRPYEGIASGQIRTKAVRKINTLLVLNVGNWMGMWGMG